ncbi:glutathione S-transferase family protein [Palleronia abyssalis]|uniref:Glutathione S-transferase n=1 Tax=Palleronia abyssalis TaxID=1501240 RepID=A0A2R8BRL5_9RHOB|nr:glutathione S-transferase family protein [Palleronia abyssalis]SPJ22736.1 hypothetical protein PAA8504_00534 [Palleronia abyssalis]
MTDFALYYWPLPARGHFVRIVLAHVGASWSEAAVDAVADLRQAAPEEQPVAHMGPPVLTDRASGLSLSQMPAILGFLGQRYGLYPGDPARDALSDKIVLDANDVLYEMTRYNGAQMWTDAAWSEFQPRLRRWMRIFQTHLARTEGRDYMLDGDTPGLADLATYSLWGTMTDKLPSLRPVLEDAAPRIADLCDRIAARPEQAKLRDWAAAEYGDQWCGGEIEASLRRVLGD